MFYLVSSNSINIYCGNIMTTIKKLILKFQQEYLKKLHRIVDKTHEYMIFL